MLVAVLAASTHAQDAQPVEPTPEAIDSSPEPLETQPDSEETLPAEGALSPEAHCSNEFSSHP